jgi:hypothetical protein
VYPRGTSTVRSPLSEAFAAAIAYFIAKAFRKAMVVFSSRPGRAPKSRIEWAERRTGKAESRRDLINYIVS